MLIKAVLLAILAYYVLRAIGNLIRAISGDEGIPDSISGKSPQNPTGSRAWSTSRHTVYVRTSDRARDARPDSSSEPEEDIEDARFRDL